MMSRMFNIDAVGPRTNHCQEREVHCSHPDPTEMKQRYDMDLDKAMKFEGLCLDCEQEKYKETQQGICRFGHTFKA